MRKHAAEDAGPAEPRPAPCSRTMLPSGAVRRRPAVPGADRRTSPPAGGGMSARSGAAGLHQLSGQSSPGKWLLCCCGLLIAIVVGGIDADTTTR
jgi:hypothetical protein